MNLTAGHDLADGRERGFHAKLAIVIESDIAIACPGIAPGNHEDGKAFTGQELDQRVLRRQVENVVFHDPGGHDQDRFRMHLAGGRIVLDQLDQVVSEYHLAGRRRDGFANDEFLVRGRLAGGQQSHPVAEPVLPAEHEILATAPEGLCPALPDW